jgi:YD repeat-containing protein
MESALRSTLFNFFVVVVGLFIDVSLGLAQAQDKTPSYPQDAVVVTGARLREYTAQIGMGGGAGPIIGESRFFAQSPPKTSNSSLSCNKDNPSTAQPVVLATGEKHFTETDFTDLRENSLGLTRTYRSKSTTGRLFGAQWQSSLDFPKLEYGGCRLGGQYGYYSGCYPEWVKVTIPGGATYTFAIYGASPIFFPEDVTDGTSTMGYMQIVGTTATIFIGEKKYTYNASTKLIQKIEDSGRLTYQFNYSDGRLVSVVNAAGSTVQFQYGANGFVSKVIAPDGAIWNYEYNNFVGGLSRVVPPGGGNGIRTYTYWTYQPNWYSLVSGVDGVYVDGIRTKYVAYDNSGRVTSSGDGENTDQFSYAANSTTVSN